MHSIAGTGLWLLAQVTPAPVDATSSVQVHSVWDFILKGGPVMIPIGLCSIVALTVIVERAISLKRRRIMPPEFLAGLKSQLRDRETALAYCKANGSPIANIMAAAVKRLGAPPETIEKYVEEAGHRELVQLRKNMRLLSALPQVSTMLGLLGTIFGMIKTFQAVAASSEALGKTEMLARGIFEAWTCTASGLAVAIPVMVGYQILMGRIDRTIAEIDRVVVDWVEEGVFTTPPAQAIDQRRAAPEAGVAPGVPVTPAVAVA